MRRYPFAVALVVGLVVSVAPSTTGLAQFKSDVQLVPLTVTVTTRAGRYVPGLTASDFTVFEEDKPQTLAHFSAMDSPVDLALLLDTSASMTRDLALAQAAACGLVRRLKPGDRGAVASISSNMSDAQPMTSDTTLVEKAIRSLYAAGATALYEGVYVVLREFERNNAAAAETRRQAIVVLSDGLDTASRIEFEDVLETVRRNAVAVYVILLDQDVTRMLNFPGVRPSQAAYRMRELARESGGRVFTAQSAHELPAIYEGIGLELSNQYLLGYSPTRAAFDGRFRRIRVGVQHPDAAIARTRAGYYAAAPRRDLARRRAH